MAQAEHLPELREQLAASYERTRTTFGQGLRELFGDSIGEDSARALVSFYAALGDGLMMQWLVDPERAPSARDVAEALRLIVRIHGSQP
ncbi:MAG: hypothetical protein GEU98_27545 [Pseudonocardiaceae bacterium]|nr:hypothetical protein [Pseudonocardiaceae bacterium]